MECSCNSDSTCECARTSADRVNRQWEPGDCRVPGLGPTGPCLTARSAAATGEARRRALHTGCAHVADHKHPLQRGGAGHRRGRAASRLTRRQTDLVRVPVFHPMLATSARGQHRAGSGGRGAKLDGWRRWSPSTVRSPCAPRNGRVVTGAVPELLALGEQLSGRTAVLDGELVVGAGMPADFYELTPRMALSPRRARSGCRVTFVAFDLLYLDGQSLCSLPYVPDAAATAALTSSCRERAGTSWTRCTAIRWTRSPPASSSASRAWSPSASTGCTDPRAAVDGLGEAQDARVAGGARRAPHQGVAARRTRTCVSQRRCAGRTSRR